MSTANLAKLSLAVLLLVGAGFGFYRHFNRNSGVSEQLWFYDLSERKLFAAPRESLPPIRGLNNDEADAVRAVVICTSGNPDDSANRKIAYLEKYAPELRQNLELAREGKVEPLPTKIRNGYRLVKNPDSETWHAANSPEGVKIMNGWNIAGPDGKQPVVCAP